jgi:FtsP/CotA-like multicopper oxidase with cupredoxin domain
MIVALLVVSAIASAAPLAAPVTINLCASTGSVTMPDSTVIPIWGFSLDTGSGCATAQLPGPVLEVNAGDVVTINLIDVDVPGSVSLEFPGQSVSGSYSFTASDPGTYLYGSADSRGVLMGLSGILIVRPATPGQAYNSAASAYDTEAVMVLSEIDPAFNANPTTFNTVNYKPKYWLINGKAYPQTTNIPADAGDKVLLRYVNAGSLHHTMTMLGMRQRVIGRDAYPLTYPYDVVAETIPAGSTLDTIATVPGSAASGAKFPLYNRQLHLTNGANFPGGMLTFIQVGAGCENQAPVVSAGSDQTITLPASATLDGTMTDDGCATVSTTWTQESGPGTVTFGNANAVDTTVTFSTAGAYMLRLTAIDDAFTVYDEVQITVNPAPTNTTHIGDLDDTSTNPGNPNWNARLRVTAHNNSHATVSGALVSGTWTVGASSFSGSCTTNTSGQCQISLSLSDSIASATFTVTNVTLAGMTYQATDNHDPDGDSNGTSITVNRP